MALRRNGHRVSVNPPPGWALYGPPHASRTNGVVLVLNRSNDVEERGTPTASMKLELGGPGGCEQLEVNLRSERSQFGQRLIIEDTKSRTIKNRETKVFHTENDLADYYYVCLSLRNQMHVEGTLTLAKGSWELEWNKKMLADFVTTLESLKAH